MSKLRTGKSLENQEEEKAKKNRLLAGLHQMAEAISDSQDSKTGDIPQSIKFGLAAALGVGGAYVALAKTLKKAKKFTKGLKTIFSFSGDMDDVEEENVFVTNTPKQPGIIGVAGLVKYGFKRIIKAIKLLRKKEGKDKESFWKKLLKAVKALITNKWFWIVMGISALGTGVWKLISSALSGSSQDAVNAQNDQQTFIDDPDLLAHAEDDLFLAEFQEVLDDIHKSAPEAAKKLNQKLDSFNSLVDSSASRNSAYTASRYKSLASQSLVKQANIPYGERKLRHAPLPAGSYVISSDFGYRNINDQVPQASRYHKGIDLAVPVGTSVIAPAGGVVKRVGYDKQGYGKYITVQHDDGYETRYAHLSNINVAPGQQLQGGEVIGQSGNTGASSGPHLHYEVRKDGTPVNPISYMSSPTTLITNNGVPLSTTTNVNVDELENSNLLEKSNMSLAESYKKLDEAIVDVLDDPLKLTALKVMSNPNRSQFSKDVARKVLKNSSEIKTVAKATAFGGAIGGAATAGALAVKSLF